jgi:hypothetical protein
MLIVSFLDGTLTMFGIYNYGIGSEANPFLRWWLVNGNPLFLLMAVLSISFFMFHFNRHWISKAIRVMAWTFLILYLFIAPINWIVGIYF